MKVKITETLERIVEVDSMEEAKQQYKTGKTVLDYSNFIGVEFTELPEKEGE